MNVGHGIIVATAAFLVFQSYVILFSASLPLTGNMFLDTLARDTHYKYLGLLFIPTSAYFVIANWVGWQYYRNS